MREYIIIIIYALWGTMDLLSLTVDSIMQVSDREDKQLLEDMEKLRLGNLERCGDEDSEEEEEDTGMGDVDVENAGFRD